MWILKIVVPEMFSRGDVQGEAHACNPTLSQFRAFVPSGLATGLKIIRSQI